MIVVDSEISTVPTVDYISLVLATRLGIALYKRYKELYTTYYAD